MSAGNETAAAEDFIFNTLTGDATLLALLPSGANGVQNTEVPQGQDIEYPVILYQFMSSVDAAAVGAIRIWSDLLYLVKVVGQSASFDVVNAIAARVDVLLHRASGTVADGIVWSCTRDRAVRDRDSIANKQYRVAGGVYRLQAA